MSEWKEYKLGDFLDFGNGKVRPKSNGSVPVFGGNGVLDYCDKYNYTGETIVIGRVGAYCGSIYYENGPIWVSDNALVAKPKADYNIKFIYYFLLNLGLNQFAEGSSHPLLTQTLLNSIDVSITSEINEQLAIASILSSLDDKIDLLNRQNKTLEQLAETLFRQWFIEEADESWEEKSLLDLVDLYDYMRKPLSSLERARMRNDARYPYYGAATIIDYINEYIFDGEYLLLAEDGTVQNDEGKPILQMTDGKFWVNNHAHIFRAKQPLTNFYLYIFLNNLDITNIITGAVQPKINQQALKSIKVIIPPLKRLKEYLVISNSFWDKIKVNKQQIQTITKLRDNLLPKLMSGEVRVEM